MKRNGNGRLREPRGQLAPSGRLERQARRAELLVVVLHGGFNAVKEGGRVEHAWVPNYREARQLRLGHFEHLVHLLRERPVVVEEVGVLVRGEPVRDVGGVRHVGPHRHREEQVVQLGVVRDRASQFAQLHRRTPASGGVVPLHARREQRHLANQREERRPPPYVQQLVALDPLGGFGKPHVGLHHHAVHRAAMLVPHHVGQLEVRNDAAVVKALHLPLVGDVLELVCADGGLVAAAAVRVAQPWVPLVGVKDGHAHRVGVVSHKNEPNPLHSHHGVLQTICQSLGGTVKMFWWYPAAANRIGTLTAAEKRAVNAVLRSPYTTENTLLVLLGLTVGEYCSALLASEKK